MMEGAGASPASASAAKATGKGMGKGKGVLIPPPGAKAANGTVVELKVGCRLQVKKYTADDEWSWQLAEILSISDAVGDTKRQFYVHYVDCMLAPLNLSLALSLSQTLPNRAFASNRLFALYVAARHCCTISVCPLSHRLSLFLHQPPCLSNCFEQF